MKKTLSIIILILSLVVCLGAYEGGIFYTVQPGETLSQLGARYLPLTAAYTKKELIDSIKSINGIKGALAPGQTIRIPVAWEHPLTPSIVPKQKNFEAKGLYMNPYSAGSRYMLDIAYRLKLLGGNTIVFDAKDDNGALSYESCIPQKYTPKRRHTPIIEEFPKMIEYLHRMGIHVVARVVVFRDPIMARVNPQWCYNREKDWLDPANPEVQEYLLEIIRELCSLGVDEIQLDYIRYFADGKTTTDDGTSRTDIIAGFVSKMHEVTAEKQVLLSMDMFGIVVWQRDVDILTVGQDVMKLKDCVDVISPMIYPSHFGYGFSGVRNPADKPNKFVTEGIERMKKLVGDDVVIRPWLQAFPLRVTKGWGPGYIKKQIIASLEAGGIGWLLWSPGNKYRVSLTALEELQKEKNEPQPLASDSEIGPEPPDDIRSQSLEQPSEDTIPAEQLAEPVSTGGVPVPDQPDPDYEEMEDDIIK